MYENHEERNGWCSEVNELRYERNKTSLAQETPKLETAIEAKLVDSVGK